MPPVTKFYALVASATTGVMFLVLTWIAPAIQGLEAFPAVASGVAGILTSVGIYRLVSQGAEAIIHRVAWVRRWIFGGTYLHGTWVAFS